MSDVVLVNPNYVSLDMYRGWISAVAEGLEPPLGLAYVASWLEKFDFNVKILDALAENHSLQELRTQIRKEHPHIVGITATTPTIVYAFETARAIKEVDPRILTVLGGPHCSAIPFETMSECSYIDICVVGEGEMTFHEICEAITKNKPLQEIRGIYYRDNGDVKNTDPRPLINDLNILPFPARHLLPMDKYRPSPVKYRRTPVANMIASRGCPYDCIFCTKCIFGRWLRIRDASNVSEEIRQLVEEYRVKEIHFYDDTLTINHRFVEDLCDQIRKEKIDIQFWINGRVDTVNHKILGLLKKAGCYRIYYGVESSTQRILDILRKQYTVEQVVKASELTRENGIEFYGFFILGNPTETVKEIHDTIEFAKRHCDYAHFTVLTPYPGTDLWNNVEKYGTLLSRDWRDFTMMKGEEPVFVPYTMSKEELEKAVDYAFRSFVMRPRFALTIMNEVIRGPSKLPYYLRSTKSFIESLLRRSGR